MTAIGVAVASALIGVAIARSPGSFVAGAVLVQVIAQLVGTGSGLLIRRRWVAMAATIVVPMTVTAVLTVVAPDLVRWLTPYGNAKSLLADPPGFVGLAVVVPLWCVLPNVLGLRRRRVLR
ncbi:hypothetical protein ACQP2F_11525 [Actinoplanes sp. CA-030573]|uniref:hypothetical protein n=1 Tax=Actinoplanes sp. CA-030573 TaxID=3239898 RepID=UPI003D8F2EC9